MSENLDREAIVKALKDEGLHETGWLSDLHRQGLEWHDASEIIVIDDWFGSVDIGHLAEVVESLIGKKTQELQTRLEQAEKKAADNDRLADELLADRDYWEAKLTNLVYSLATEEEVGEWSSMNDIADNLIDHIGGKIQKLEQAVAGVHALNNELSWSPNHVAIVQRYRNALDGEPNE